eukprot:198764_1
MESTADTDEITKQSLHNLHKQQTLNGNNNNDKALNIIEVLGGIDMILSDYLNDDAVKQRLGQNELNKLHQIITSQKGEQLIPIPVHLMNTSNQNHSNSYYEFHTNDTVLGLIFGDAKAQKISNIIRQKIVMIILVIGLFTCNLVFLLYGVNWTFAIYQIIIYLLWIPLLICWILSANVVGLKLLVRSFEFWFKVSYSIMFGTAICIYYYNYGIRYAYGNALNIADLIGHIVMSLGISLCIITVSAFDIINISKCWKLSVAASVAFMWTVFAVMFQFSPDKDDYIVNISATNSSLSFQSILASTLRILAIFTWKQAILTYVRTKGKSILLKKGTFIRGPLWKESLSHCAFPSHCC